jgi:hypothetical protein
MVIDRLRFERRGLKESSQVGEGKGNRKVRKVKKNIISELACMAQTIFDVGLLLLCFSQ